MSHLDPERTPLLALGEPATDEERAHLDVCDSCAIELAELEHTVAVGRSTATLGDLEAPPERVWQGIAEELGLSIQAVASPPIDAASDAQVLTPPNKRRRSRTTILFALAATVAVAFGAVGTWFVGQQSAPMQIAAATLDSFPSHPTAVGEAVVVEDPDGIREVKVTLAAAPDDGHREVWLITADASALISLGVMEGDEAAFPVPDDIDLEEYVLVDVSLEPDDGNPDHSGDSIVRGELTFA